MKLKFSHPLHHLYCFLGVLLWSTIEFSSKFLSPDVSPYSVTAWRFLIGGLVLLPFALSQLKAKRRGLKLSEVLYMVFLGILIVCISMLLLQLSITYGKASISAILVSSNPMFVVIFAFFILRERITITQFFGLLAGLAGIGLLILGEGDLAAGGYPDLSLSIALAMAAALVFGLYAVLTKQSVVRHGNIITNCVAFLGGAVLLFAYNALAGKPMLIGMNWQNALVLAHLGISVTGIAYIFFFEGAKKLGAGTGSLYFFLKPVAATLLAVTILGENISPVQVVAISAIIIGLLVSNLLRRRNAQRTY
ncbi:MAG: DMT family transporter [Candidatus Syntrophosphaera sp.]